LQKEFNATLFMLFEDKSQVVPPFQVQSEDRVLDVVPCPDFLAAVRCENVPDEYRKSRMSVFEIRNDMASKRISAKVTETRRVSESSKSSGQRGREASKDQHGMAMARINSGASLQSPSQSVFSPGCSRVGSKIADMPVPAAEVTNNVTPANVLPATIESTAAADSQRGMAVDTAMVSASTGGGGTDPLGGHRRWPSSSLESRRDHAETPGAYSDNGVELHAGAADEYHYQFKVAQAMALNPARVPHPVLRSSSGDGKHSKDVEAFLFGVHALTQRFVEDQEAGLDHAAAATTTTGHSEAKGSVDIVL